MKPLTAETTAATLAATPAIAAALGVPEIPVDEDFSALTDEVTASVWVGKSFLAASARACAELSIFTHT